MTISRSRGAHLAAVALALGLPTAPLASQQPQPTPASAATQSLAAPPATHTVQQGETLWGLAKQFLGDPLLWPEIYRLNTTVVEDPHWIFPGEELRFAPAAETAAARADTTGPQAPVAVTAAPTAVDPGAPRPQVAPSGNPFDAPTIFAAKSTVGRSTATLQLQNQQAYRAVRAGEHFAAGFLTEGEHLNAGRLLGNTRTASISRLTAITSATVFSEVAVTTPPGDTLFVGDLLLSYQVPRRIDPWGEVVRPTGLLRVTAVGDPGDNVMAQVTASYQAITSDQSVIRVAGFTPNRQRATAVDSGIVGSVIDVREPSELVTPDDALFIDRGAEDGVQLGDIFQISGTTTAASGIGRVVQNEVQVLIVHLRPHTATGIVIQIDRPDVRPGATARQIRRVPS